MENTATDNLISAMNQEHPTVQLTEETIEKIEKRMADAVQKAIIGAINEDTAKAFWSAGIKVLQEQAQKHTGRFILGGLWVFIQKATIFLLLGGFVYWIGGWGALVKFGKTIFTAAVG